MNYRNCISEKVPSLESVFVDYLNIDTTYHMQGTVPSNRQTIYYLLFEQDRLPVNPDEKTLLLHSVFKDSFIDELNKINLSDDSQYVEPLLYYILHRDIAFPTNSKYSQFLSNMFQKNYTGKGQPPQVRYIINAIDFNKMSHYIDNLIQKQEKVRPISTDITTYINHIFYAEPKLLEISGLSGHETLSECLTWIFLYALLDEVSFLHYCQQETNSAHPNCEAETSYASDSISLTKNSTFITHCKTMCLYCKTSINVLLVFTVIQMVCFTIPFFSSGTWDISQPSFMLYCIVMLIVSVLLLTLRYVPYHFAKEAAKINPVFETQNIELHNTKILQYNEFRDTTTDNLRREKSLWISFATLLFVWLIFIIISITLNSFPILLAGILLSFVVFLYTDHYYNQICNVISYDHIDLTNSSTKQNCAQRGLAKQYAWDYSLETNNFKHRSASELPNHSAECIRYIFHALVNRHEYLWISYTILSVLLNSMTLIIGIIQFILPLNSYFRFSNAVSFPIFCLAWIFINDIIYIILLLRTENHYNLISKYQYYCSNPSLSSQFLQNQFQHAYNCGILSNIDIGHGVYNYHCKMNDLDIPVTDVQPIDDRMIVVHRYYDKVERVTISTIALCFAFICIVVWHFKILAGLWCIPVMLVLYPLFTFVLLPWLDRKFVGWCVKKYLKTLI